MIDQLKELGELQAQGIPTEEEFAAQKAKLHGPSVTRNKGKPRGFYTHFYTRKLLAICLFQGFRRHPSGHKCR